MLEVSYAVDRDLHLEGRGLRLVPSYLCRGTPTAFADPALPPTIVYPVDQPEYAGTTANGGPSVLHTPTPLGTALLNRVTGRAAAVSRVDRGRG